MIFFSFFFFHLAQIVNCQLSWKVEEYFEHYTCTVLPNPYCIAYYESI